MTGRIRPGIYVLGLVRLRNYGCFGVGQLLLRLGSCPRSFTRRGGPTAWRAAQSPSGFRSRR